MHTSTQSFFEFRNGQLQGDLETVEPVRDALQHGTHTAAGVLAGDRQLRSCKKYWTFSTSLIVGERTDGAGYPRLQA